MVHEKLHKPQNYNINSKNKITLTKHILCFFLQDIILVCCRPVSWNALIT